MFNRNGIDEAALAIGLVDVFDLDICVNRENDESKLGKVTFCRMDDVRDIETRRMAIYVQRLVRRGFLQLLE